jgi:hypothetical protein
LVEETTYDETTYEISMKLMRVPPPSPPAWNSSYSMRIPEELEPGMVVQVTASSFVTLFAYIFKMEPDGSISGPLVAPSPSSRLLFEYAVGAPGTYLLRVSQTENSAIVDAKVKMVFRKPRKPETADDGASAGIGH